MDYRIKRQLGAVVGALILGIVILLATRDARAEDIRPRAGPAQRIADFERVNDACIGAPLRADGKYNPVCARRDRIARALERAGYERSMHDVWFRSSDVGLLFKLARIAASIPPSQWTDPRAQLHMLCAVSGIDDLTLFAIWQQHAGELRDTDPRAWAIASELTQFMVMRNEVPQRDPRFMLAGD